MIPEEGECLAYSGSPIWDPDQYCLDHDISRAEVAAMVADLKAWEKARELRIADLANYLGLDPSDLEDQTFSTLDADDVIDLVGDMRALQNEEYDCEEDETE